MWSQRSAVWALGFLLALGLGCSTRTPQADEVDQGKPAATKPPPSPAPSPVPSPAPAPSPSPLPQPPGPGAAGHRPQLKPIVVFNYNLCWECMSNSSGPTTGGPLGKMCPYIDAPANKTTLCADHMASTIEQAAAKYGAFDFVAFQEATNWDALVKRTPALQTLTPLHFKRGRDDFVTLYDSKKYTLEHKIEWGMTAASRPYQILIFKEKLIFVNIHNCHGFCVNPNVVSDNLSRSLKKKLSPADIAKIKDYRIIMAGDLNDHGTKGKLRAFSPFDKAGITTLVAVTKPPATCCATSLPWAASNAGDYILDSKPALKFEVPVGYDRGKPQSDHLPVVGVLQGL